MPPPPPAPPVSDPPVLEPPVLEEPPVPPPPVLEPPVPVLGGGDPLDAVSLEQPAACARIAAAASARAPSAKTGARREARLFCSFIALFSVICDRIEIPREARSVSGGGGARLHAG
jgi:hypothetical protein